jgi:hypothetical protein
LTREEAEGEEQHKEHKEEELVIPMEPEFLYN